MTTDEKLIIKELPCVGKRLNSKQQIRWFFEDGETLFGMNFKGHFIIGGIYAITFDDEDHYFTAGKNGPKYLRKHEDEDKVLGWTIRHQEIIGARDIELAAGRASAAAQESNAAEFAGLTLRQVRTLYQTSRPQDRAATLAAVLREIGVK